MKCFVITKKHIIGGAVAVLCICTLSFGIKNRSSRAIGAFKPEEVISQTLPHGTIKEAVGEIKEKIKEKTAKSPYEILNDCSPVFPDKTDEPQSLPEMTSEPQPLLEPTPTPEPPKMETVTAFQTEIRNDTEFNVERNEILSEELTFSENAAVLIVHTHTTESYAGIGDDNGRSLNEDENMVAVGNVIENGLKKCGISVIHDKTVHDYPSYRGAYGRSLKTVQGNIKKNPSIEVVIDVHRDAIVKSDGTRVKLVKNVNGENCAQMMVVCGTNGSGLAHPNWRKNLKFSILLSDRINQKAPSLMRPVNLREERFNQHLTAASIILEVGTNGNTIDEAKRAAEYAAAALAEILKENRG